MDVNLLPGERRTIRLPGLGTRGYRWTHRVEGDTEAVAVTLSPAPPAGINGRQPGTSVDELAVIEGRHPGRATVTLEQRRGWESTAAPQDRRVVTITVGPSA